MKIQLRLVGILVVILILILKYLFLIIYVKLSWEGYLQKSNCAFTQITTYIHYNNLEQSIFFALIKF